MADILPQFIPSVVPGLSGPAISFSAVRKVTEAAKRLGDELEQKIRTSVQSGLADAAREGARLETKVLNHLRKQLTPPEQLIEHITSLVQNSIAGSLAQAVTTFEDLTSMGGTRDADGGTRQDISQREKSFVYTPATSQQLTPRAGPMRATVPVEAVLSPPVVPGRGALSLPPPPVNPAGGGPCDDEALWNNFFGRMQATADGYNPGAGQRTRYGFSVACPGNCIIAPEFGLIGPPEGAAGNITAVDIFGTPDQIAAGMAEIITLFAPYRDDAICGKGPPPPLCPNGLPPPCAIIVTKCPDGSEPPCPPPPPPPPPPPCCPEIKIPPCPPIPPLPSCIRVDFCDWDKLCETLKNCLAQQSATDCALDNDTAYLFKDCDGTLSQAQEHWWGDAGKEISEPESYQQLLTSASAKVGSFTDSDFAPPNPYG